ncbi:hypothetical protein [Sinorhizobium fredii]|uniref:hypothetical protein n=1 Tax=Rhizobium fredii TaxID=380 RepID=UPI003511215A
MFFKLARNRKPRLICAVERPAALKANPPPEVCWTADWGGVGGSGWLQCAIGDRLCGLDIVLGAERDPVCGGVWNNKTGSRCRTPPIRLFEAVSRGLAAALLELGLDPSAPVATMRCKNPLSPIWKTRTPNSTDFMTLTQYAAVIDMRASRQALIRRAVELQSKMGRSASNELFNKLLDYGSKLLSSWHFAGDSRIQMTTEEIGKAVHGEMESYAITSGLAADRSAYVIEKVAYTWQQPSIPRSLRKLRLGSASIISSMTCRPSKNVSAPGHDTPRAPISGSKITEKSVTRSHSFNPPGNIV